MSSKLNFSILIYKEYLLTFDCLPFYLGLEVQSKRLKNSGSKGAKSLSNLVSNSTTKSLTFMCLILKRKKSLSKSFKLTQFYKCRHCASWAGRGRGAGVNNKSLNLPAEGCDATAEVC